MSLSNKFKMYLFLAILFLFPILACNDGAPTPGVGFSNTNDSSPASVPAAPAVLSSELNTEEVAAVEPWLNGDAPPPAEFTITSIEYVCQQMTTQNLRSGVTVNICQNALNNLAQSSALFAITAFTPVPGDEWVAGVQWVGNVKDAGGIIKTFLFLATADFAIDQAVKMDLLEISLSPIPHSSTDHNPAVSGSWANEHAIELHTTWTTNGGPPDDTRCAVLYVAGVALRGIYWVYTHTSALGGLDPVTGLITGGIRRGNLLWTDISNIPGGAYNNASENGLFTPPKDVLNQHPKAYVMEQDCNNMPPPAMP